MRKPTSCDVGIDLALLCLGWGSHVLYSGERYKNGANEKKQPPFDLVNTAWSDKWNEKFRNGMVVLVQAWGTCFACFHIAGHCRHKVTPQEMVQYISRKHLCPTLKRYFRMAVGRKRQFHWNYAWVKNGKICVLQKLTTPPYSQLLRREILTR